jgi:hypothetical protein
LRAGQYRCAENQQQQIKGTKVFQAKAPHGDRDDVGSSGLRRPSADL